MGRREEYMVAFVNSTIEKKIKVLKALRKNGKYLSVSSTAIVDKLDIMSEVLNELYPENWDIFLTVEKPKLLEGPERLEELNFYNVKVVIHYENIFITNTREEKHLITDLFIEIGYSEDFNFKGLRMSATKEEIMAKYQHSHLKGRKYTLEEQEAFNFRSFCLGSSEIKQVLKILNSGFEYFKVNTFKLFILQLEEYLNWESIEGNPHCYISSINGGIIENLPTTIVSSFTQQVMKFREDNKAELNFILKENQIKVKDDEKLEEFLKVCGEKPDYYSSDIITSKNEKGMYFNYKKIYQGDISRMFLDSKEDLKKISFLFRGTLIEFKIKEQTEEQRNKPFYLHKQIKENVTTTIEKRIEETRVRNYLSEQYNTIKNQSENTKQNRLFVPLN